MALKKREFTPETGTFDTYGGVTFSGKKRYKGLMFNVISITREWVGGSISRKKP